MAEENQKNQLVKSRGIVTIISIIGLILAAAVALLILSTWFPSGGNPSGGQPTPLVTPSPITGIITTRPPPTTTSFTATGITTVGTPHTTIATTGTTTPVTTGTPYPTVITTRTTATATTGTPTFSISVNPVTAVAKPGDLVTYHMIIAGTNGFSDPVQLSLHVSAVLVYNRDYDLGTQYPPYPKTVDYPFTVPSNVPRGITVNGLLTARSGSIIHQAPLILQVG